MFVGTLTIDSDIDKHCECPACSLQSILLTVVHGIIQTGSICSLPVSACNLVATCNWNIFILSPVFLHIRYSWVEHRRAAIQRVLNSRHHRDHSHGIHGWVILRLVHFTMPDEISQFSVIPVLMLMLLSRP